MNEHNEQLERERMEPGQPTSGDAAQSAPGSGPESLDGSVAAAADPMDELFAELLSETGEIEVSAAEPAAPLAGAPDESAVTAGPAEPESAPVVTEPVAVSAEPVSAPEYVPESAPEPVSALEPESAPQFAPEPEPEPEIAVPVPVLAAETVAVSDPVESFIEEPLEFGLFEAPGAPEKAEPGEAQSAAAPEVPAAVEPLPEPVAEVPVETAAPVDSSAQAESLESEALVADPPAPEFNAADSFDAAGLMLEELLAEDASLAADPVQASAEPEIAEVEAPDGIDVLEAVAAPPVPAPPAPAPTPRPPAAAQPLPRFEPEAYQTESRSEPERASVPALDDLIRGIDEQLETASPVSVSAEQPVVTHKQFSQLDDYVVFSLSGGDYALPVRDVAEIGRVPTVTRVPNVPEFVRGITNLRGEIVPVLNLPHLLGLQETPVTARGRVLFLQAREHVAASGLLVDEVKGIQRIPSQQLEHVTGLVDDKVTSVLRGVHGRGDRLLNVLDLEQVFRLEEFQKFDRR